MPKPKGKKKDANKAKGPAKKPKSKKEPKKSGKKAATPTTTTTANPDPQAMLPETSSNVGEGAFGFVKAGVNSSTSHGPLPVVEKRAFKGEEDSLKRENRLFDLLDDRDLISNDVGVVGRVAHNFAGPKAGWLLTLEFVLPLLSFWSLFKNVSVKSLALIGLRISCALAAFHAVSMSHGDVKIANLGVKDLGCGLTIVLLDMATWSLANELCPALGTLFFTPFYGNDSNLVERQHEDVFGAVASVCELATGLPPLLEPPVTTVCKRLTPKLRKNCSQAVKDAAAQKHDLANKMKSELAICLNSKKMTKNMWHLINANDNESLRDMVIACWAAITKTKRIVNKNLDQDIPPAVRALYIDVLFKDVTTAEELKARFLSLC